MGPAPEPMSETASEPLSDFFPDPVPELVPEPVSAGSGTRDPRTPSGEESAVGDRSRGTEA